METTTYVKTTPEDQSLIYRVVGFLEYGTALRLFDQFLRTATKDERLAADEIIRERPEFTVYTGLAPRSPAELGVINPRDGLDDGRKRLAFPWVIALARVELGGIFATFGNPKTPFQIVVPSEYESEAYRELLLDGANVHYLALVNDPLVRANLQGPPSRQTLAYIRRFLVAKRFHTASLAVWGPDLLPSEVQLGRLQTTQLDKLVSLYREKIIVPTTQVANHVSFTERDLVTACRNVLGFCVP